MKEIRKAKVVSKCGQQVWSARGHVGVVGGGGFSTHARAYGLKATTEPSPSASPAAWTGVNTVLTRKEPAAGGTVAGKVECERFDLSCQCAGD